MSRWVRTSPSLPCPVCQRPDWCGVTEDGTAARCMRVPSDRESNGGWIHRLQERPEALDYEVKQTRKPKMPIDEIERLADMAFHDPNAVPLRKRLARKLNVSVDSLVRLRVGWSIDGWLRSHATFPAIDGNEQVIGITRRYDNGKKLTTPRTSNSGVFADCRWSPSDTLCVTEGPSDVAAALSHGMWAIGRPSNSGGAEAVSGLLKRHPARHVIVVGENDRKPDRPGTRLWCPSNCEGCPWCWPGKYGAEYTIKRLAKLGCKATLLMPPPQYKDLREWLSKRPQGALK